LDAMPKGSRKKALVSWMVDNGKFKENLIKNKSGQLVVDKEKPYLYDREAVTTLDKAIERPWFDHKPENMAIPTCNIKLEILKLMKKVEKTEEKGGNVEHSELKSLLVEIAVKASQS